MSCRIFGWIAAGVLTCGALSGCGSESSDSPKTQPEAPAINPTTAVEATSSEKNPASTDAANALKASVPVAPAIDEQVAAVQSEIDGGNLEAADEKLAALRASLGETPSEDQLEKLRPIEKALSDRRESLRKEERTQLLQAAKTAFDNGDWDESLKQIDAVAALAPGEAEREILNGLRSSIDKSMKAQLKLASWIKMLGSTSAGEVKTAQTQLLEEPEAALPLVRAAIKPGDPVTTKNALEFLRKLRKPEIALPIMVSVLEDPAQQAIWETAAKEIVRQAHPGAGPRLLELVLTSSLPEQRLAATNALASIVDPPETTALSLLPILFRDGSELAVTLSACTHSVLAHHQHDLLEWRALSESISDSQAQQLNQLIERLKTLQALPADQQATSDAARQLAIALRMIAPEPIAGLQILDATSTDASVKPAALLDGVWNSIDPATMWWTPVSQNGFVVLDLGTSKTVTGVRIWNLNESGAGYRGWKDVEIYVSDTQTALRPVSQGNLLPAPGVADPLDYSQVIPVNFAKGRYVKLACKEYLAQSSHAGLTEIQILGY
jgi:hypothetical protein